MKDAIDSKDSASAGPMTHCAGDHLPLAADRRCFADRPESPNRSAKLTICIIIFSCLDAYFTLLLTSRGAVELNPVMAFYLNEGPHHFVAVKLFLTCSALFIFYVYRKEAIRTLNFRISQFLPLISVVFVLLLAWEMVLFYRLLR